MAAIPNEQARQATGGESHAMPLATSVEPINEFLNERWKASYAGVSRCNAVLRVAAKTTELTDAELKNIIAQARFLRGHYYFELKRMYNMVPWIDENTTDFKQPNDKDIWPLIEDDFKYAVENVTATQPDAGRINKMAAQAYLGKLLRSDQGDGSNGYEIYTEQK